MRVRTYSDSLSDSKHKIAWISFIVIDFCNLISQTQVLKALAAHGYSINFFATRSSKTLRPIDSKVHSTIVPLKHVPIISSSLYILSIALLFPLLIITQKPDYIILETGPSILGPIFMPLKFALKFKLIMDVRSVPIKVNNSFRASLHQLLFRISITIASRIFNGLTILTDLMKKQICADFDVSPSFLGVWTSGVNCDLFNPKNTDRQEVRNKLELNGKFVILYHGGLGMSRIDGVLSVIKSLKETKSHKDIIFLLLGRGDGVPVLNRAIQESHLEQMVLVHKNVQYSEVPKFIAACDLGIVPLPDSPNWRHQCPLKLLEYLAMGKVVVVTDIPANRAVIRTCKCGIYIKSIDPLEIAKAITYAYDNRHRLDEWGELGTEIIEKEYSWEKVAMDLHDYLSKL